MMMHHMSPSQEPMTIGSPQSPASPGSHSQHQFLPPYLMGEPAPMVNTPPSSRMWSASSGSPPRSSSHINKSGNWGPPGGGTPAPGSSQSLFVTSPRSDVRASGRSKEKSGAPPVTGLLESIQHATPASGKKPGQSAVDVSQNASFRQSQLPGSFTPGFQTPGTTSTPAMGGYSHPKKTPPSPAQMDPFYTQGDALRPNDELNETWVTVFGFPPAATSYILQQFSQYGSIVKHVIASDGNWMHVHYQSKFQAKKALSKNGKIFGGSIMVGVNPCIDKSIMDTDKENADVTYKSFIGTPTQSQLLQQTCTDKNNSNRSTPIRPLTAAYKAASSDHEVISNSNTPQKNNGVITKAMEYVFGW